jgi:ribosome modulation factor
MAKKKQERPLEFRALLYAATSKIHRFQHDCARESWLDGYHEALRDVAKKKAKA